MKSTEGYCHRRVSEKIGVWYAHFGARPWVELHGLGDPIVHVRVEEATEGDGSTHWAWWSNEKSAFMYLWPSRAQVAICFPYGPEPEEALGRGKVTRVRVIESAE